MLYLCVSLLLALGANAKSQFSLEPRQKLALREAIFRHMFRHYSYGASVKVYCIAAERPLPDEFIRRFDGVKPRVVCSAECDNSGPMNAIVHKKSGEHGMLMKIVELHWESGDHAEAEVEAFSDGIAANWNILQLHLQDGRWVVKSNKLRGVS